MLVTFMTGVILFVAGYFRAGGLIAYVPEAVVNGLALRLRQRKLPPDDMNPREE